MELVVSLLPSTTEIVCALGLEEALIGRSHECDFPSGVAGLPVLTAAKYEASALGVLARASLRLGGATTREPAAAALDKAAALIGGL